MTFPKLKRQVKLKRRAVAKPYSDHPAQLMASSREYLKYEIVSPVIKYAIRLLPQTFFYLYPFPYALYVNEKGILIFEKKPGFWKFLPYYLSLFLITGGLGLSMNNYVIFSFLLNFRVSSTLDISLTQVILLLTMATLAISELVTMMIILCYPELLLEFKSMSKLDRACKFSMQNQ